jgi:hypothetical protein
VVLAGGGVAVSAVEGREVAVVQGEAAAAAGDEGALLGEEQQGPGGRGGREAIQEGELLLLVEAIEEPVDDEETRGAGDGAGEAEQEGLALGEGAPLGEQVLVEAVREGLDDLLEADEVEGAAYLLDADVDPASADVLGDGPFEELDAPDQGDVGAEPVEAQLSLIDPVEEDDALGGRPVTPEELGEGALAAALGAVEADGLAGLALQRELLDDRVPVVRFVAVAVAVAVVV